MYQCPRCGSTERLAVVATCWMRLVQFGRGRGPDVAETENRGGNQWDDDSDMICDDCGQMGTATTFYREQD
jgi:uncharacterized membrane protein YjdF